ncbi:hypothetical protein [Mycolicibacterium fortuitum]|uniref:hypothetical protein n=1 Tax=Mycolicibacterium fortuitum TaxID=1766 RepID=UPI001AEFDBB9|nr:hypothetical protein [Mycolicibacterium fortuitum]MBP3083098.1 hypothetical protein [Mycolicibacterium fortuitum]
MSSTTDGYLRISADRARPIRDTLAPGSELGLLFIDIQDNGTEPQYLCRALQNSPLAKVRFMLFRWPVLGTSEQGTSERTADHEELTTWLESMASHEALKLFGPQYLGVIRFNIGDEPQLVWHKGRAPDETMQRHLLDRALRVEFSALLDWGHGIWRPRKYHYVLPSGTHSDVFVKISDAFRTPQDVYALTSWMVDRLRDDLTIVADTADLIPLVIQLQNIASTKSWHSVRSEVLDEYPRTRADLFNAIRAGRKSAHALILFSVNASGTYRDTMHDIATSTFKSATEWSMIVLIDKTSAAEVTGYYAKDSENFTTWYGLAIPPSPGPHNPAECKLCTDPDRSQVVLIDPRTFEAVALPGANLIMPDTSAAKAGRLFWTACSEATSVEVLSYPAESPSVAAREKEGLMDLKINTTSLWESQEFIEALRSRLKTLPRDAAAKAMRLCDCIIVSSYDLDLPNFNQVVEILRDYLLIGDVPIISISDLGSPEPGLVEFGQPLIFSAGSVTGWNIRQLLCSVQESWQSQPAAGSPHCLVVHARPTTIRQWQNLASSFERRIFAVWTSYLPEFSPLIDEAALLTRSQASLQSEAAKNFLKTRLAICKPILSWSERLALTVSGAPNPRAILWGLAGDANERVRNESLYGTRIDAISAYAAIGSAMQSARQLSERSDPRWPMFDLDSISRSYFDGIIVSSILRWARPGETWWGANARDQRTSITSLVKRTQNLHDQVVLFPELLLAAAQGKLPRAATQEMIDLIDTTVTAWPADTDAGPITLGKELVRVQSLNSTP